MSHRVCCSRGIDMGMVEVALVANDDYALALGATICSICKTADRNRDYMVHVVSKDLSDDNKIRLARTIEGYGNVFLHFVSMERFDSLIDSFYVGDDRGYIRVEAYFRLLLPDLLPNVDRVIYSDCDVVFTKDIGQMFDIDLHGNSIGAPHEGDAYFMYVNGIGDVREYWDKHGFDPQRFFYSGSMVMDLAAMRERHDLYELVSIALSRDWAFHDLDVLNKAVHDVEYIDPRWCSVYDSRLDVARSGDPIVDGYVDALDEPWQIHYGGPDKPWLDDTVRHHDKWVEAIEGSPWEEVYHGRC